MSWKLKSLIAIALLACGAVLIKLPSQAQSLKNIFSSETVQNADEIPQVPTAVIISNESPATLFSYTGPAVAIPDNLPAGVNIVLPVAGSGNITDLNFVFDTGGACDAVIGNTNAAADHTFVGDLTFRLTSPTGQIATFMARRGGTRENICSTTIDDDSGAPNVSTLTSVTGQFVGGPFTPETTGPLSVFDGFNANGNWTLNVSDNASLDTGSMRRFSLDITSGAATPSFSINDVAVTEGNAGTTNAMFTVTLAPAAAVTTTITLATADQTAVAPGDYTSAAGTVTFLAGETTKTVVVPVVGDTTFEPNETYAVNLTAPTGGAVIGDAQGIGTITNDDASPLPACNFSNGGLNPQATAKNGTAAPAGKFWSEVQNNAGNTAVANTGAGSAVTQGTFRLADNFTVPAGGCQLSTVTFFAYQTGAAAATSPFAGYTLQIWNGRPGDAGATVVFGDTTTNRLASSVDTGFFRIFNTIAPPPGTATGTTRIIWRNTLNASVSLTTPGTYWLDWASTATNAAAHFQPTKTIEGARGAVGDNARQLTVATGVWADVLDTGNPVTPPSVNQDYPFFLNTLQAPTTANADYNGDGKTDWVVARGTNTPLAEGEAQSTIGGFDAAATEIKGFRRPLVESDSPQAPGIAWYVKTNNAAGSTFGAQWGDAATDFFVAEDFDGDGKSDFTVWRPGAPDVAAFYILQSQTNTVKTSLFGQTGDDAAVVGDYDGDNKADVATYRCPAIGAGDGQCFFYYRGSLNNPGNNITFVPWGFGEDGDFFPNVGDYDGDGKNDFCVQRTNPAQAGQGQFVLKRSSDGATEFINWGNSTDFIIPGDYDGDGKSDFCVRRTVSGARHHYILTRTGAQSFANWGITGDASVPGDYDGDGKTDIGVWRGGATGQFYVLQSSNGASVNSPWGTTNDFAVAGWAVH